MKAPIGSKGSQVCCHRSDVIWGFYPFSPGCCSISMPVSSAESSILIGCALVLIPSLFWLVLPFLLSTLWGHREVIMEVSRGPSISLLIILREKMRYSTNKCYEFLLDGLLHCWKAIIQSLSEGCPRQEHKAGKILLEWQRVTRLVKLTTMGCLASLLQSSKIKQVILAKNCKNKEYIFYFED
jgi:hypothetical protein